MEVELEASLWRNWGFRERCLLCRAELWYLVGGDVSTIGVGEAVGRVAKTYSDAVLWR